MKTRNFPGKVNQRRINSRERLINRLKEYEEALKEQEDIIHSAEKALKFAKSKNIPIPKDLHEKVHEANIRIAAIDVEKKPLLKELDCLNKSITSPDVARARRTKKNRDGQMRKRN